MKEIKNWTTKSLSPGQFKLWEKITTCKLYCLPYNLWAQVNKTVVTLQSVVCRKVTEVITLCIIVHVNPLNMLRNIVCLVSYTLPLTPTPNGLDYSGLSTSHTRIAWSNLEIESKDNINWKTKIFRIIKLGTWNLTTHLYTILLMPFRTSDS